MKKHANEFEATANDVCTTPEINFRNYPHWTKINEE